MLSWRISATVKAIAAFGALELFMQTSIRFLTLS
jgi:hypothetical protein